MKNLITSTIAALKKTMPFQNVILKTMLLFSCLLILPLARSTAAENQDTTKITIRFKNQPLDSAFAQLRRQIGCRFVYQDEITGKLPKINQKFKDASLSQILDALFAGTGNSCAIIGSWIVLYKTTEPETAPNQSPAPLSIKGKVVNENGNAIREAHIYLKEKNNARVDNSNPATRHAEQDGTFAITTDDPDAQLVVAFIGYYPRVVPLKDATLVTLKSMDMMIFGWSMYFGPSFPRVILPDIDTAKITIRFRNQPLDSALRQLERQGDFSFTCQDEVANNPLRVNQKFKNKTLSQILDALLAGTGNSYVIFWRQVVTYKTMERVPEAGQNPTPFLVKGKVLDCDGYAVPGVTIRLQERNNVYLTGEDPQTFTGKDGTFVISTDDPNARLVVVYLGHHSRVVHVKDAALIKLESTIAENAETRD
ncbi:MAG: hypothetical protein LBL04_13465 [Bacteroidales bacterium]|jgi:protocatechuate 3,4-dioxygenase beta subunit|nr:hypothetical protein [Bacteroidales bacterium]